MFIYNAKFIYMAFTIKIILREHRYRYNIHICFYLFAISFPRNVLTYAYILQIGRYTNCTVKKFQLKSISNHRVLLLALVNLQMKATLFLFTDPVNFYS